MRRYWWWAAGGAVVLGVVAAIVWWPSGDGSGLPPARARVYQDFSACLLTGPAGLTAPGVGPVWSGMQDASASTSIKVSYLAASGPETEANYLPYLNSLLSRNCDVVVTAGEPGTAVALGQAAAHPKVRFVSVGGKAAGGVPANVTGIAAGDGVREDVKDAVETAVDDAGR